MAPVIPAALYVYRIMDVRCAFDTWQRLFSNLIFQSVRCKLPSGHTKIPCHSGYKSAWGIKRSDAVLPVDAT